MLQNITFPPNNFLEFNATTKFDMDPTISSRATERFRLMDLGTWHTMWIEEVDQNQHNVRNTTVTDKENNVNASGSPV